MNKPLVGIIILHWKGIEDTRQCLRSLLSIHYPNRILYCIDNASLDHGASQLSSEFEHAVRFVTNERNLGYAGGNNVGIMKALEEGCDYVMIINNDTIVEANFLNVLVETAEHNPRIGIIGPKIFDGSGKNIWFAGGDITWKSGVRIKHRGWNQPDAKQLSTGGLTDFFTGCCLLIRRDAIRRAGLIPEEYFLYFEDTDWSVAVQRAGFEVWYEPRAIIWHKEVSEHQSVSPIKSYYTFRNYPRFVTKYASFYQKMLFWGQFSVFILITFFRNVFRGKAVHNRMMARGIRDYFQGQFGPLRRPA